MRSATILFLTLFLATAGCGTNGEFSVSLPLVGTIFKASQKRVDLPDSGVDFGGNGAPSDGRIVGVPASDFPLIDAQKPYRIDYDEDPAVEQPVDVEYDVSDFVQKAPTQYGWNVRVMVPVEQRRDGTVAAGTQTLVAVDDGGSTSQAALADPRSFALAAAGLELDISGGNIASGWEFDVIAEREPNAPATTDEIVVQQNGQVLARLPALGQGNLIASASFNIDRLNITFPIELHIVAASDSSFNDIQVDFPTDLSPPPFEVVQARIYDLPFAPEATFSETRGMFARTHPVLPPTALGEFAFVVYGEGFVEALSKPLPDPLQQTDSGASPAAGTTYDGGTIGLKGNSGYPSNKISRATHPPVVAARIMVGSWGISIANFDNTLMTFESPTLAEAGNMTDYSPFDGDPESGFGVYCDNTVDAIKFISRDAQNQYVLAPAATITNAVYPNASGKVVSAFRHSSGDLLFVTDGDPGELWVLPDGATTATKVDDVFAAPRRVRAAANIAAVTCFGGVASFGGMKVFVRSAAGTWSAAPFGLLGTRSVGCDLKVLPDSRVAIGYTNFSDNTARIVVTEADGQFSFSNDFFLPGGVTGPGHCTFCEGTSNGLWVSAYTSQHLVLLPVFFSPP